MEQVHRRFWTVAVRRIPESDPPTYSVTIEDGMADPELSERTITSDHLGSLRWMLDCLFRRGALVLVNERVESGSSSVMGSASLTNSDDAMSRLHDGQEVTIRPDATREELIACLDNLNRSEA